MLRHLLDDAADAEDVLQQSYIRALESLGTLRDQERLTPWFDRVIRNAAWDSIRRRHAEARALVVLSREVPETSPFPAGADSACRCATRLLGVLPAGYAEVLRHVYLDEAPVEVVAFRLRTTPNNVRVRLHRARVALREQLIAKCEGCRDQSFRAVRVQRAEAAGCAGRMSRALERPPYRSPAAAAIARTGPLRLGH
jgi:RNA polymerase sigma-70 factor (ECF subfamily)